MLIKILSTYSDIISDIQINRFRKDRNSYEFLAILVLHDGSYIHVRDYLFPSGQRKFAYQWQSAKDKIIGRWDNAPHWPNLKNFPYHFHDGKTGKVVASNVKDIYGVLEYIRALGYKEK